MKRLRQGLLVASVLALAQPAAAAPTAYMTIRANGTDLRCESTNPSFEDHAEVIAVATNLAVPLSSGGLPTGPARHTPLRITKKVDRCTPLLSAALVTNQVIELVIKFVRLDPELGTLVRHFTIELRSSKLVGQSLVLPDTLDPASAGLPLLEHLSFTIGTIVWRDEATGTETSHNAQQLP